MSDSVKEGVSLEPGGRQSADAERDLLKAMKHYQAGERQEALSLVRPWADQGDPQACLLAAKLYKDEGDVVRCRNYLYAAGEGGDGDAALMLAQEYVSEDPVVALEWAEKAHEGHIPGAGRLILRLAATKGHVKESIRQAAEELVWLDDDQGQALVAELTEILKGDPLSDEELVEVLRPIVDKLPQGAVRQALAAPVEAVRERREQKYRDEQRAKRQTVAKGVWHWIQPLVNVAVAVVVAVALNVWIDRIVCAQNAEGFMHIVLRLLGGAGNCAGCGMAVGLVHHLTKHGRLSPTGVMDGAIGFVVVAVILPWALAIGVPLLLLASAFIASVPAVKEFLAPLPGQPDESFMRAFSILFAICWGAVSPYAKKVI